MGGVRDLCEGGGGVVRDLCAGGGGGTYVRVGWSSVSV